MKIKFLLPLLFFCGVLFDNAMAKNLRLYVNRGLDEENKTENQNFNGSHISLIHLNKQQVQNLTLLAQVWGFIKYHHPSVAEGKFNMDTELFRIMPTVINCTNSKGACSAIEKWVDSFGIPSKCTSCKPYTGNNITQRPNYGMIFNKTVVSESLINKLTYILNNRKTGRSYYIEMARNGNPVFKNELAYIQPTYPDAGYRLLSLFRYWNMIQYYFPYKNIIGRDWNAVLPEFIPKFIVAKNAMNYQLQVLSIISSIHDTHANIWSDVKELRNSYGQYLPTFKVRFIENKLVVTGYWYDTLNVKSNLKKGDIITSINGRNVDVLVKEDLPTTPASNYVTQLRNLASGRLLVSRTRQMKFQLIRDGKKQTIIQEAIMPVTLKHPMLSKLNPAKAGFTIIDKNIGYLYPANYHNADTTAIYKAIGHTKGVIIDMRCYPSDLMWFTFVPFIKFGNAGFVKFGKMEIDYPGLFKLYPYDAIRSTGRYKGKVVVIVNEETQSRAEYTTMAFQSSPNVTVIGSTTAGADGDVSEIILPGGIKTMISGLDVLYPDGRQTQRLGVKIDIRVKPTITGVKAGRDELLEKAMALILHK